MMRLAHFLGRNLATDATVAADASPHRALLQFSAAAMKSAAAATEPVCCNIQPGITPQKIWYCDTAMGWYPNQASANLPNPSNEVCCLRSTCADKDIIKWGAQPQRCAPGWEFDSSKAAVSPPSRRRCCKAVATCRDIYPEEKGAQWFYCNPANGVAQNPNAAGYPNPSQNPTCADRNVNTQSAEPWQCPSNQRLIQENAMLGPPSNDLCCTMMPGPTPSPSPSPAATSAITR
ncbi:hypothetical protein OEZ86_009371 [Tetradesmus obliquus]|nr:hypothetical protein OEZ86_009371 [Tetradesmus obliquus]